MSKEKIREFFNEKWKSMGLIGEYKISKEAGCFPDDCTSELISEQTLPDGEVISLFDEYDHGVIIYQAYGEAWHYYIAKEELKRLKYVAPKTRSWLLLSTEYKSKIENYLRLIGMFRKDPMSLSVDEKKWVLKNANLPTDLVPTSISSKYL